MILCVFGCGAILNPNDKKVWHRVKGWERPGAAGGSDIALRERDGNDLACPNCIRQLQRGLAPSQGALL